MNRLTSLLTFVALLYISFSAISEPYSIVSDDVCTKRGNYISNCSPPPVELGLTTYSDLVPAELDVSISINQYCSTPYPISLEFLLSNGQSFSMNALQPNNTAYSQGQASSMTVSVNAPYSRYAYFDSRCEILADIAVDQINVSTLTDNLSNEKDRVNSEIEIVRDRIDDKSTIGSLMSIGIMYESLIAIAESDLTTYAEINHILIDNCDQTADCTWSDQIGVVLNDPSVLMPFSQMLLLFNLGTELDNLVPADCTHENCMVSLIGDSEKEAIESITTSIDTSNLESEIEDLTIDLQFLNEELLMLRQIALDFDIEWSQL